MSELIFKSTAIIALFLMFCYGLSLAAHMNWFFSLLSQFKIQFFFGALLLIPLLIIGKEYPATAIMIIVSIATFLEIYNAGSMIKHPDHKTTNRFTVLQYNKLYENKSYDQLSSFIQQSDIDVLIMQEVKNAEIPYIADALSPYLQHSMPDDAYRPDYVSIFSKHPIKDLTVKKLCHTSCATHGVRFIISKGDTDIAFYTIHTKIPIGQKDYIQHTEELASIAQWIKDDAHENVILAGDLNTTPFSPVFKNMKNTARLRNQRFGIIEQGTWPVWGMLPIFKIPLDHIMNKGNLSLINKHKGPAMGSDHHSLIATYAIE